MNNRKAIYIPSLDAKDAYLANTCLDQEKNKIGYRLITQAGSINYNRFINTLDFSLDSEKLMEIAQEVYAGTDKIFTFFNNGKEYSDKVINITFKYSCRSFNKVKKNTYIAEGYLLNELSFNDCIAIEDNQIVGIITSTTVLSKTLYELPEGFVYEEDKKGNMVYTPKTIKVEKSRKELRDYLYENGFNCNGNHYIRMKRTSGSARVGKCLFIEESLYPKLHEWEMCGLKVNNGDSIDLAALESYISLPTSSAIDTLQINPKSILIVPDYDSKFKEKSVVVEMTEKKTLRAYEDEVDISNSIFDGQSMIDISIMGEYATFGMVLLRNRFFKSCCFNTNIQQWFKDNNITELSQLHPNSITLATSIKDIKLITTPNSIKYLKFAPLSQWLECIDSTFSVVKHEKKTHFFDGRFVQAHYQLLNTLQLSPDEVRELLKPSLEYVNLLNTNTDVLKYHVKCSSMEIEDEDVLSNVFKDKNEIVYTMMNLSSDFYKTKYYYDFKKETCKSYLKNMKKGHILINGNYSVLFGNPYEMLLHTINEFDGDTSLPPGHIHTTRYEWNKNLLGCRSPHITTSNILISRNMRHDLIDKYFNLTDEIVCINAINENILERLSGADYDSDQMIVSDNEIIINAALKNYDIFKVPANRVTAKKSKRFYTNEQKSDLDHNTSENKIGEIVNLSQELNTLMWDYINHSGKPLSKIYDEIKDIYYDICILNVLSCVEIDKAKKEFDLSSTAEIKRIKEKWQRIGYEEKVIKPAFLGFISQTKGFKNIKKKQYDYHDSTMDYVLREIKQHRSSKTDAKNLLPLSDCFKFNGYNPNSVNYKQLSKIVQMCESTMTAINAIWSRDYYSTEEKYTLSQNCKDNLVFDIQSMKINEHTMYVLISYTDSKKYAHISKLLFFALFNYKNNMIINMMTHLTKPTTYISESNNGDIDIYGIKFKQHGGSNVD